MDFTHKGSLQKKMDILSAYFSINVLWVCYLPSLLQIVIKHPFFSEGFPKDENEDVGIVILIESGKKQPKEKYKKNSVKALSILQIVLGIISCNVGFYQIFFMFLYPQRYGRISTIGEGIFCGIPFLITGILGLISLKNTSYGKITAFLVFSILSAISGGILIILSSIFLVINTDSYYFPGASVIACPALLTFIGLLEED